MEDEIGLEAKLRGGYGEVVEDCRPLGRWLISIDRDPNRKSRRLCRF